MISHDQRRVIRHQRNQHARQHQPARINDLELLIALGKLTDRQREAWIDSNILGDTSRTIATRMGCSPQYVSVLQRQATSRLADILGRTDFISRWAPEQDAA